MKKFENSTELNSYINDNATAPLNEVVASDDNNVAYNFDIGNGNWSKFGSIHRANIGEDSKTNTMPTDFSDFELADIETDYKTIDQEFHDINDWSNLETINIPDEIETIEDGAFSNCGKLTRVVIGKGLKTMTAEAFRGCPLVELIVRSSQWDWKNNKFLGFPYLSYVRVNGHRLNKEELLAFTGGGGYYGSNKGPDWGKIIARYYVNDTSIPTPIFSSGNTSFSSMEVDGDSSHPIEPTSRIVFNTIGEHTVKFTLSNPEIIYSYTFAYCTKLTSVEISNSVITIDDKAFRDCSGLTSVTIGNSVTSIGNQAFVRCTGLTSIEIPNTITSISDYAFSDCTGLTSVTVLATTPPTLYSGVFDNNASGRKIYVPAESINAYKAASGWSDYAADIEAIQ